MLKKVYLSILLSAFLISKPAFCSNNSDDKEVVELDKPLTLTSFHLVQSPAEKIGFFRELYERSHVKTHREDPNAFVRMGSLDGGGLRGLIFLPQLRALEILTGKPIHELFDIIGGTSTGGISAIALSYQDSTGKVASPKDLINLYLKCGRDIFRYSPSPLKTVSTLFGSKYSSEGLECVIKKLVGPDCYSTRNFKIPVLITAVNANLRSLKIFSTDDIGDSAVEIWKVARATSAAQTFFPPVEINNSAFIDGGHMSNSPASDFMDQYVSHMSNAAQFQGNNKLCIFSFGTGDVSLIHETNSIFNEYAMGKVESTIEFLFTAQERTSHRVIEKEVELFKTKSAFLSMLKSTMNGAEGFRALVSESLKQEPEAKGYRQFLAQAVINQGKENAKLASELAKQAEELKQHSWVQAYYRSQTTPLPTALHEMDKVEIAPALFQEGLKMIKSDSFKQLLCGIFGENFVIGDDVLDTVCNEIRDEAELIDVTDTRPLTMLSIVNDFLTKMDSSSEDPNSYFSERMIGYSDLSQLTQSQSEALSRWTDALLLATKEHKADRSFYSWGVGLFKEGSHDKLIKLIKGLRQKIQHDQSK